MENNGCFYLKKYANFLCMSNLILFQEFVDEVDRGSGVDIVTLDVVPHDLLLSILKRTGIDKRVVRRTRDSATNNK